MNKNKLFKLLDETSSEKNSIISSEFNMDLIKVKMFIKLIGESDYLKDSMKKMINNDSNRIDKLAEELVFNRAVEYIEIIDIDSLLNSPEFTEGISSQFIKYLQKSIKYFEIEEKYEICAFLFNIEKLLRKK